eukprot:gene11013-7835_t
MIRKSYNLTSKKLVQHLISEGPDLEDVSATDEDVFSSKKDASIFAWLQQATVGVADSHSHWHHHLFSDSLFDSHRQAPLLRSASSVLPVDLASTTARPVGNSPPSGAPVGNAAAAAAAAAQPTIPFAGCLTEIPFPDRRKHIVPPPPGNVTIVCCNTTAGVLNIEVHPTWAPIGAGRFLEMVRDDFFRTRVPLFRALRGFLIQFGLAGDPEVHKRYHAKGNLQDDPTWLPLGPRGRSVGGITRYQKGYLGYAGAGKNSRGTQLIVALANNKFLGGGCPWEVPWGQVFGEESLATLDRIYTGYGEKVSQGKIMNRGIAYVEEEFPRVDVITDCRVVREDVAWRWRPAADNTNADVDIRQYRVGDKAPAAR